MSLNVRILAAAVVASLAGMIGLAGTAAAQHGNCDACAPCPRGHGCFHKERCPPPFVHRVEGPPHLRYKHACPRPVCDPCSLYHWGYYQPCWRPWPFPPDYNHCPVPPVAAYVPHAELGIARPAFEAPRAEPPAPPSQRELPAPEKLNVVPPLEPTAF
jgi:hypothetical protein